MIHKALFRFWIFSLKELMFPDNDRPVAKSSPLEGHDVTFVTPETNDGVPLKLHCTCNRIDCPAYRKLMLIQCLQMLTSLKYV